MIGKSNSRIIFKGKKPTKFRFYLMSVLGWIYVITSLGIIYWLYESSEISGFYKFGIVFVLMFFTPSFSDLFESYSSFVEKYYKADEIKSD